MSNKEQCWGFEKSWISSNVRLLENLTDFSEEKRTPKFIGEILAMIDNDPSKSIKSLAKDMGMSELLIKQVVHEDIRYFSYKMRKS